MDELVKGVKGFSWFLPYIGPFFVFGEKTLCNPSHSLFMPLCCFSCACLELASKAFLVMVLTSSFQRYHINPSPTLHQQSEIPTP